MSLRGEREQQRGGSKNIRISMRPEKNTVRLETQTAIVLGAIAADQKRWLRRAPFKNLNRFWMLRRSARRWGPPARRRRWMRRSNIPPATRPRSSSPQTPLRHIKDIYVIKDRWKLELGRECLIWKEKRGSWGV